MKLIAQVAFSWAHRGVELQAFEPGEKIDTEDEDLIAVSTREGWAAPADGESKLPVADAAAQGAASQEETPPAQPAAEASPAFAEPAPAKPAPAKPARAKK